MFWGFFFIPVQESLVRLLWDYNLFHVEAGFVLRSRQPKSLSFSVRVVLPCISVIDYQENTFLGGVWSKAVVGINTGRDLCGCSSFPFIVTLACSMGLSVCWGRVVLLFSFCTYLAGEIN